MKSKEINELVCELKEYCGEFTVKVWSNGTNEAYPISHVGQGYIEGELDTYVSIVVDDDDNLVDLLKIWHDVSEEPKEGELILVEVVNTIPKNNKVGYYVEYVEEWVVNLMKTEGFKSRWAYISDLLPKGGEK